MTKGPARRLASTGVAHGAGDGVDGKHQLDLQFAFLLLFFRAELSPFLQQVDLLVVDDLHQRAPQLLKLR